MKQIYCDKCLKEIKVRDDLVTATIFFEVIPYHEDCYAKDLKGAKTLFLNNQPVNGFSGNLLAFFALIVLIVSLFLKEDMMIFLTIFMVFPILYRVYSYIVYERHIEK